MGFEQSVHEKILGCRAALVQDSDGDGDAASSSSYQPTHGKVTSKVSLKRKEQEPLLEKIRRRRASLANETATEAAASCPFFKLSPELRHMVYNEIATDDTDIFDSKSTKRVAQAGSDITNLMRVSREIREEAKTTSFLRNHFVMTVSQEEMGFLSDTIRCDDLCRFTLPPLSKAIRNWIIEVTFCSANCLSMIWNPSSTSSTRTFDSIRLKATFRRTFRRICDQLSHNSVGIRDITIQIRCGCKAKWGIRRCFSVSHEREEHLASCIKMIASRVPLHGNFKIVGTEHLHILMNGGRSLVT